MASYITWYDSVIDHMLRAPTGTVGRYIDRKGVSTERLAVAQVGKETYDLVRSISRKTESAPYGVKVTISAWDRKAMMHHEGTRPHIIRPRNAKVLRFKVGGKVVYASLVRHPGTKPNRFLTDNLPKTA